MSLAVVVLAAGEGKRMKSGFSKVLYPLCGWPMVCYVVEEARALKPQKLVVVVGHKGNEVQKTLQRETKKAKMSFASQERQLGTAHALSKTKSLLGKFKGTILALNGDTPLITSRTLSSFVKFHQENKADLSVFTANLSDPYSYGRVVRDKNGEVERIVEEKDAVSRERQIKEVNSGIYCFEAPAIFDFLKKINHKNKQGEYYLTDVVEIFKEAGKKVLAYRANQDEIIGVNSQEELSHADKLMRMRINSAWMKEEVSIVDPSSVFIDARVVLSKGVTLYPFSFLQGKTKVGSGSIIGPMVRLIDTEVGKQAEVQFSVARGAQIGDKASVGPFCHLREGAVLEEGTKAGTFVEIKKSKIGKASKIPHLSYVGDAIIGQNVNIGAGTVTCNYDGEKKHKTVIGDDVFIGSDTQLIAPVKIGRGAVTGASSAITVDVPDGSLALERSEQRVIKGWRRKKHPKTRKRRS